MSNVSPKDAGGTVAANGPSDGQPQTAPKPGPSGQRAISRDGLTPQEAQARLAQYGYNELPEKTVNALLKFLSYFWGPIPGMIEVAMILSAIVGHWDDFAIILVLLLANAVIGFWEEYQAGNAIAALKARLALSARVKRGGTWTSIPARELVPGDLIRIRLGDIVPADAAALGGRSDRGGSVGADRRIAARQPQDRRDDLFGLDRAAGRGRCRRRRHRRAHLLRQDGEAGRVGPHHQPFPKSRP